jgi:hypothetical protein
MVHVNVSRASILLNLEIIGIDVNVLNGRRMAIMFEYRNPKAILRHMFSEEFPNGDLNKLDKILSNYRDEEVDRVVDGAMRFGLAAMLDVIDWREHKRI